jgi:hypothetical protein
MSGLQIDHTAFDNALIFVDEVTDPPRPHGLHRAGQPPSRMPSMMDRFPAESSEALTAVGMVARIFAGHTLDRIP